MSQRRLSVLIFHRVLPRRDPLLPGEPDAEDFERVMRLVRRLFNVVPLADGVDGIKTGKLPPRSLSITFDDGYANNAEVAAPILARLGLHATFFVATGFLDGGRMFNDTVLEAVRRFRGAEINLEHLGLSRYPTCSDEDRVQAVKAILATIKYRHHTARSELAQRIAEAVGGGLPGNLMMTSRQVAGLARAGFSLGGHTISHPILADMDREAAKHEILGGVRRLEEIADCRVRLFAYPNGRPSTDYVGDSVRLVRELGFDGAVSTSRGSARIGSDPFQIPRFTPWEISPLRFTAHMTVNRFVTRPDYAND